MCMTSCCPRRRMRWSGATGAIARCKNRSTGYVRKPRSAHAWRSTCGEKPKGQGATKPSTPYMRHVLPEATRYPCYSLLVVVCPILNDRGEELHGANLRVAFGKVSNAQRLCGGCSHGTLPREDPGGEPRRNWTAAVCRALAGTAGAGRDGRGL